MRQLKSRFKLIQKVNRKNNKRKIKNKMFPILLSLLVVSVTTATTQAYFNDKVSFESLIGGSKVSSLNITNGNVKWEFGTGNTFWSADGNKLIKNSNNEACISNPSNGKTVTYGPVTLTSKSNLTTNVDLAVDFSIKKVGGVDEGGDGSSGSTETISTKNIVEPFEVIVGDMDNFGFGFETNTNIGNNAYNEKPNKSGTPYDIYKEYNTKFNRAFGDGEYPSIQKYSREHNGMSVFPSSSYDATGTDRRMVNSAFYDWLNNHGYSNVLGQYGFNNLKNKTGGDMGFVKAAGPESTWPKDTWIYNNLACYYWAYDKTNQVKIWYDGYTDRAIKGIYGVWSAAKQTQSNFVDDWVNNEQDHIVTSNDGTTKNWRYLQKVEPLTFKYAKIPSKGEINSLCIQVYVDDLQPEAPSMPKERFSYVSKSKYAVKVSADGTNWMEIEPWSNTINSLAQSGPSGQMVTLNMSDMSDTDKNKFITMLKKASGITGSGLKFKIDDENYTPIRGYNNEMVISGDSYAIDFAKMTVNGDIDITTDNKMEISGIVTDSETGKSIEGVKVMTSNASSTETNSSGYYSLIPMKENLTITFIKDGYLPIEQEVVKGDSIELNVKMKPKTSTVTKTKVDIKVIVDELIGDDTTINDASKVTRSKLQRIDSSGENIIKFADIIEGEPNLIEDDGYGNKVIRTETQYNNISSISATIQQAQCSIGMKPNSEYRIYYQLILKDKDSIDAISDNFSLEFESSLMAKATQENNPNWHVDGTGKDDIFKSSYSAIGAENTTSEGGGTSSGGTSGGSTSTGQEEEFTKEYDKILLNDTPEIYFENYKGWRNGTISINLNGNPVSSTNLVPATNWYKATLKSENTLKKGSIIKVQDQDGNTSGNLYYFNTKKVFICTN